MLLVPEVSGTFLKRDGPLNRGPHPSGDNRRIAPCGFRPGPGSFVNIAQAVLLFLCLGSRRFFTLCLAAFQDEPNSS